MIRWNRQRANLTRAAILTIATTASLLAGGALASAQLSPEELPAGTVAIVTEAPPALGTITKAELNRSIAQVSAQAGLPTAPKPTQANYRRIEEEALDNLFDLIDIEGEAAERSLVVAQPEISAVLAQVKRKNFKSEAEFRRFLHDSKLSVQDVRESIKLQILAALIERDVTRGIHGQAAQLKALSTFVREYKERWKARTTCAPQYASKRCSNLGTRAA